MVSPYGASTARYALIKIKRAASIFRQPAFCVLLLTNMCFSIILRLYFVYYILFYTANFYCKKGRNS